MGLFETMFGIREVKQKKNTAGNHKGTTHHNLIKNDGNKLSWNAKKDSKGSYVVPKTLHSGGKGKKNKKIY